MVFTKKKPRSKKSTLRPEQQYWQAVGEQAQQLITQSLTKVLPLDPAASSFEWAKDKELSKLLTQELPAVYQADDELPEVELLAHELTYHYLNTLCSNLQDQLTTNYEEN